MIRVQAKITAKGQVTLPKGLRTALALREGDHVQFTLNDEGGALLEKRTVPGASAGCGARFAAARKAPASLDDIRESVAKAMAQRYADQGNDDRARKVAE